MKYNVYIQWFDETGKGKIKKRKKRKETNIMATIGFPPFPLSKMQSRLFSGVQELETSF